MIFQKHLNDFHDEYSLIFDGKYEKIKRFITDEPDLYKSFCDNELLVYTEHMKTLCERIDDSTDIINKSDLLMLKTLDTFIKNYDTEFRKLIFLSNIPDNEPTRNSTSSDDDNSDDIHSYLNRNLDEYYFKPIDPSKLLKNSSDINCQDDSDNDEDNNNYERIMRQMNYVRQKKLKKNIDPYYSCEYKNGCAHILTKERFDKSSPSCSIICDLNNITRKWWFKDNIEIYDSHTSDIENDDNDENNETKLINNIYTEHKKKSVGYKNNIRFHKSTDTKLNQKIYPSTKIPNLFKYSSIIKNIVSKYLENTNNTKPKIKQIIKSNNSNTINVRKMVKEYEGKIN